MSRQEWIGAGIGVAAICVTIGVSSGSTNARIDDLRADFSVSVQNLRADLRELGNDVDDLRADVGDLRRDVDSLRTDVDRLNRLLVEHTTGHVHDRGAG